MPEPVGSDRATYVTIADQRYFTGAVALVNSLRLTGHRDPIVVLDGGLSGAQRRVLARECEVRPLPVDEGGVFVVFAKSAVGTLGLTGPVVLLDSDMIVTRSLAPVLASARAGRMCGVVDLLGERRFDAWTPILGLPCFPREQRHMNAGLVAFDAAAWGDFLERWSAACRLVPRSRAELPFDLPQETLLSHPFALPEQDVLNALLMTEVEPERIEILDIDFAPGPLQNDDVQIESRWSLACRSGRVRPFCLHYWNHPKPWLEGARPYLAFDAYVELLARVLTSADVPLRIPAADLPVWLRDDLAGRLVRRTPRRVRRGVRSAVAQLPDPLERRARDVGGAVAQRIRLG